MMMIAGTATENATQTFALLVLQQDDDDQQYGGDTENAQQQYIQHTHFMNLPEGEIKTGGLIRRFL